VLQCVVACCSVLQCVAVCCSVLQCVAVCCSVLQCAAVCCDVLQCVAVCCSVLQCVAMCCSVLLYMSHVRPWSESQPKCFLPHSMTFGVFNNVCTGIFKNSPCSKSRVCGMTHSFTHSFMRHDAT